MQALTFMAPAPIRLARGRGPVLNQIVIAAADVLVRTTCWTASLGETAGKVQALAFVAPAPIILTNSEVGHNPRQLSTIGCRLGAHTELRECCPNTLPRRIVLTTRHSA